MTTPLRELSWQDVIQKSQNRELDRAENRGPSRSNQKSGAVCSGYGITLRREQLCIQTSYQNNSRMGSGASLEPLQLHRNYISHLKNDREREGFRTLITANASRSLTTAKTIYR